MRKIAAMILVLAPMWPLAAGSDDQPHRRWDKTAWTEATLAETQACVARVMDRMGSVLVLPVEGGADIDFTIGGGLFVQGMGEPYARFQVRDEGSRRTIFGLYRHPLRGNIFDGSVKSMQKRCAIVITVEQGGTTP
jgi:hypothetical protein